MGKTDDINAYFDNDFLHVAFSDQRVMILKKSYFIQLKFTVTDGTANGEINPIVKTLAYNTDFSI